MSKNASPVDEAAIEFLKELALTAEADSGELDISKPFIMGESGWLQISPQLSVAQSKLISSIAKALGPTHAHEPTLRQVLWREVHRMRLEGKSDPAEHKTLIKHLKAANIGDYRLLMPNNLWVLPETSSRLAIGPVEAMKSAEFLKAEPLLSAHQNIKIGGDPAIEILFFNGGAVIELEKLGPICWLTKLNCAEGNVNEEARWLIEVAISLVRLRAMTDEDVGPSFGELELAPFDAPMNLSRGVRLSGTSFHAGGLSQPCNYRFGPTIIERTATPAFVAVAESIFGQNQKHLSTRMFQALGWLSRARQSADNSERLLGFFTALEALLSDTDKTSPIVDTIARRAGVIWSDNPPTRRSIAERVKRLYNVRSMTVHRGMRLALQNEARQTQQIAETICAYVLRSDQLASPEAEFFEGLRIATFGGPWEARPKKTSQTED